MVKPKAGKLVAVRKKPGGGKWNGSGSAHSGGVAPSGPGVARAAREAGLSPTAEVLKKVFVHVKDPEDQTALMRIRNECSHFPGLSDMVLVLGPDKQSAIKMPFRVDGSDELIGRLVKILGEDAVVLK
jgi:hypothetical protein